MKTTKNNMTFMKVLLIAFFMNFLLANCQVRQYGESVQEDTKRIFTSNKNYIVNLSIEGIIVRKSICEKCKINRYSLVLKINNLSVKPDFGKLQYQPYYFFSGDSLLTISVPKELYQNAFEQNIIRKDSNEFEIFVNNNKYQYLSKEEYMWLP